MDLDPIKPVFASQGPFVTVYAEVGRDTEDAVARREARSTNLRHRLEHAELGGELIEEVCARLVENTHLPGSVRRTIVASDEAVLFDDVQPGRTHWPEAVDVGQLPHLSGWLASADVAHRFLLVVADRVGADIAVHRALAGPPQATESVDGEDFYITKVAEGDWAHKQFQQTAENTWKRNAERVADTVRGLARRHATTATLVAGETRARAELLTALERQAAAAGPVIEIESGGRADGASSTALWQEVEAVVTTLEREADSQVAARLQQARGQGDGAAFGLDEIVAALAQSRVELLVLDLTELDGQTVATDRLAGIALPAAARQVEELPAERALVAAAALTGASLTLLPSSMSYGPVAGLLRWGSERTT